MLVFTRKRHEAIVIGDGIEVRVLRVGRDGVRLGVTAPSSISVHRREIYDQIRAENRVAATVSTSAASLAERLRRGFREQAAVPAGAAAASGQPAFTKTTAAEELDR
jgi:carbon storage regulator